MFVPVFLYLHTRLCTEMATKTISLDEEAYERLIVITSSRSGIDRTTACGRTGKQSH
jgi:hypothetical protein